MTSFITNLFEDIVRLYKKLYRFMDGITIKLPTNKIQLIKDVNDQLTKETTLEIEDFYYKKMIIRDVNNYIGEYIESTIEKPYLKLKGCFEIDKEYHKNPSMKIVPIAIMNYFIKGIPLDETIQNHTNIYDFCIRLKINSATKAFASKLENGSINNQPLDRTTRFYISNKGCGLNVYYNNSTKVNRLFYPNHITLFNNYVEKDDYDINYTFYKIEALKIINVIEQTQLELWN